jgi:hypothetical protein
MVDKIKIVGFEKDLALWAAETMRNRQRKSITRHWVLAEGWPTRGLSTQRPSEPYSIFE